MRKHVLTVLLMGVLAFAAGQAAYGFESHNEPDALIPLRSVTSSVPAGRWDHGFLTGNGRMGAVVYGQPAKETITFNLELTSGIAHDRTREKPVTTGVDS